MVATDAIAQPPGFRSLEQYFDGRSLHTLRSAVAAHAAAAGLGRQRVYDVTAAAHELAANTVMHGAGQGLSSMLSLLAADCPRQQAQSIYDRCGAYFPQLSRLFG